MLSLLLVAAASLGIDAAPFSSDDRQSYEAALAQVGRDPDAHVRLALWCEAHGLNAERLKHLSLAVLNAPGHPLARGLMGLVSFQGRWQRPEAVGAALMADAGRKALMAEYEEKRAKLAETAEGHYKLALWCEEHGLKGEAIGHFRATVRLDPSREAAWKHLGYKKQKDGRWLTDEQVARDREEAELQKQADRHWKPLLEKWRNQLGDKDPEKRAEAEKSLDAISDPRAVAMIWLVFAAGSEARQEAAVQVLGHVDSPGASRALAMLAIFSGSAEVRRRASETLVRRDVREFGEILVGVLRDPIKYEVRPVSGPGSQGELFVQGKKANYKRLYSPPAVPNIPWMPGETLGYDANGLPAVFLNEGGVRHTGRIPVSMLLGGLPFNPYPDGALGGASPAAQSQAITQFQHRMAQSGQSAEGNALAGAFRANPSALNLFSLSWGGYGSGATGQMSPMSQIAASLVAQNRLPLTAGLDFTISRQLEIPIGQIAVNAQQTAAVAQQKLQDDVAAIERYNEPITKRNDRVVSILKQVAGQDLGTDRESWLKWWNDQIGYAVMPQQASQGPPTVVENVPLGYQAQPLIQEVDSIVGVRRMSCFGAGTLVQTLTGPRPIETLRVGDEVLTQNLKSGALNYQPIVAVHHNPPAKTFRIAVGGETVVSSQFHRFWKAGKGWVMARDLAPGDTLRTLGGLAKVESVETGAVEPVFNLDVAEDADFFVGTRGALVHDNTLPDLRQAPFDAGMDLAVAAATPR